VSFIGMAFPLSSARNRLTGTGTGPDGLVFRPTSELERVGPSSDAGEEVALHESAQVVWPDIADASVVNVSVWDKSG
jgi:hypothetical protein